VTRLPHVKHTQSRMYSDHKGNARHRVGTDTTDDTMCMHCMHCDIGHHTSCEVAHPDVSTFMSVC
jgi:hypothetical protein